MFKMYYVTDEEQADGYHVVHAQGCTRLRPVFSVIELGKLSDYNQAMHKAHQMYPNVRACFFCSPVRHYQ